MHRIAIFFLVLPTVFTLATNVQAQPEKNILPPGVMQLEAQAATVHGKQARFMVLEGIGNICYWQHPADWLDWQFTLEKPGPYVLELKYSCQAGSQGSEFEIWIGGQKLACTIAQETGTWYDHETMKLGTLTFAAPGKQTLELRPTRKPGQAVMNLAWLRLIPAGAYEAYLQALPKTQRRGEYTGPVFLIPNFHPASCGWLTDFSTERNYCAYSYLDHLDRVRDDPTYGFALSEVNNIMAIMEFEPQRVAELKQRIREGRVELVNAFFLEPTINLSGGEALVKMGVEGLRWQEKVLGARPRLVWAIDVTGVHEQMGQITTGLELDGLVYTRSNPTTKVLHWLESPDGTRALCIVPGHYSEWGPLFNSQAALNETQIKALARDVQGRARRTPIGAPVIILGGHGDYSLAPTRKTYPSEFLKQWQALAPQMDLRISGPGKFLDEILPGIRAGKIELPVTRSGARLTWTSFWVQCPRVKTGYRHAEHALQTAESVATVASLKSPFSYPVEPLYHAWLQMLLNMDRNTLWGAAGGMVFEHPLSWDVRDRFESVEAIAGKTSQTALNNLLGKGTHLGLFNSSNWKRSEPVLLKLPKGKRLAGVDSQAEPDGFTLCQVELPSLGVRTLEMEAAAPAEARTVSVTGVIETKYYSARIDPKNGALTSLRLKPSGREVLSGPVFLVAEKGLDGHNTPSRPKRPRLADSSQFPAEITVRAGPLATVVTAQSTFHGGGKSTQVLHFYKHSPRIDFDIDLNDLPNQTVVVAEFPLKQPIKEVRRGIPYGFSHGTWNQEPGVGNQAPKTGLLDPDSRLPAPGYTDGIQAAIRWSHYVSAEGSGVALLDRGLPGRELIGNTPVLFLLNAQDKYMGFPGGWLSGKGKQHGSFALLAHEGSWLEARIPQAAWEYNCPPVVVEDVARVEPTSFLETSDNVIVEAVRREGRDMEIRLVESMGKAGTAQVQVKLPHTRAMLTDLVGGQGKPLSGGPAYQFSVRPQQIVTLRLVTAQPVPEIEPLLRWDDLVPPSKLKALKTRLKDRKGHPPHG